ncbi:MAG: deoxyuridine 5'-triphosphate nucleotidohydrolase [Desulfurococcales archaeon]|nr:deoxyuridine 5'-triphosphate nucleotidohydrolase [Desulfurococcales archaeon]
MFLTGDDVAKILGIDGVQVQPAGVDLRVGEVRRLESPGLLGEADRRIPEGARVEPVEGWWSLGPGAYRIRFLDVVRVPPNVVGLCFPRSSLLRMGALVGCAVWDPGYVGRGEALLAVFNPMGIRLEQGARVAQLVYATLRREASRLYEGVYKGEGL